MTDSDEPKPRLKPNELLWEEVDTPEGTHDIIVFKGPKHHLEGWIMQGGDSETVWVARTATGTRAEFDNEEDARAFLALIINAKGET